MSRRDENLAFSHHGLKSLEHQIYEFIEIYLKNLQEEKKYLQTHLKKEDHESNVIIKTVDAVNDTDRLMQIGEEIKIVSELKSKAYSLLGASIPPYGDNEAKLYELLKDMANRIICLQVLSPTETKKLYKTIHADHDATHKDYGQKVEEFLTILDKLDKKFKRNGLKKDTIYEKKFQITKDNKKRFSSTGDYFEGGRLTLIDPSRKNERGGYRPESNLNVRNAARRLLDIKFKKDLEYKTRLYSKDSKYELPIHNRKYEEEIKIVEKYLELRKAGKIKKNVIADDAAKYLVEVIFQIDKLEYAIELIKKGKVAIANSNVEVLSRRGFVKGYVETSKCLKELEEKLSKQLKGLKEKKYSKKTIEGMALAVHLMTVDAEKNKETEEKIIDKKIGIKKEEKNEDKNVDSKKLQDIKKEKNKLEYIQNLIQIAIRNNSSKRKDKKYKKDNTFIKAICDGKTPINKGDELKWECLHLLELAAREQLKLESMHTIGDVVVGYDLKSLPEEEQKQRIVEKMIELDILSRIPLERRMSDRNKGRMRNERLSENVYKRVDDLLDKYAKLNKEARNWSSSVSSVVIRIEYGVNGRSR